MSTDPKLLTLTQWMSSSYPIGSFAWSHGLEMAIADSWIEDRHSLTAWLNDLISAESIRSDAVLVCLAYNSLPDEILDLNQTAAALGPSRERRKESVRQGAAFSKVTRDVWQLDLPDLLLPVAVGHAGRQLELRLESLITVFAHSTVTNLVLAAQRLMSLGQSDAQRIIAALANDCERLPSEVDGATYDDLYSNCFLSDIASMRHEVLEPRLFQS